MAVAATPVATPAAPPARASRMASDRNWVRMWPLAAPRARRSPISERLSSTEMIMMLATPTAPTSRDTAPRPRNRPLGAGDQRVGGLGDVDLARVFGVGGGGEQGVDGVDLVGGRPQVDLGGVPVEAEVGLGGGEADQHGGVDLGGEDGRVQDAGQVEPLADPRRRADPDPLAWV